MVAVQRQKALEVQENLRSFLLFQTLTMAGTTFTMKTMLTVLETQLTIMRTVCG